MFLGPYPDTKGKSAERPSAVIIPKNGDLFAIWLVSSVGCVQGYTADGIFHGTTNYRVIFEPFINYSILQSYFYCEIYR